MQVPFAQSLTDARLMSDAVRVSIHAPVKEATTDSIAHKEELRKGIYLRRKNERFE